MTRPSWLATQCLRLVTSGPRAEAIIGDVIEDLSRTTRAGQRASRVRLELETWRHVIAEGAALVPSRLRSAGFVVRDASRSLRSTPAVSVFVIAVLTVAISAATITFSVVDAVVLRPFPFPESGRLAMIHLRAEPIMGTSSSAFMFNRFREGVSAFSSLAATVAGREQLTTKGGPEPVLSARVTASLFDVLGVRPVLGQPFDASHEVTGNDQVAILSYDMWQRRFGGDESVIGSRLALAKRSVTILGVLPRGVSYPIGANDSRTEIWMPYVVPDDERSGAQLSSYLQIVGRLAPGATLETARAQAAATLSSAVVPGPSTLSGHRVEVRSLSDVLLGKVRGWMLLVLGAVVLVLLVACANVANLLLTRATRRARELSIRASIGASRRHLVATMLVESLTLSLVAAGLGIGIAYFGVEVARNALPKGIVRASTIALDWRVFVAAVSAAIATGLLFGAVPAWLSSRSGLVSLLKQSASQSTIGGSRWRSAFLVAQVAFVGLLLVATTLFVTSFVRVTTADLGFERRNLLKASGAELTGTVADVIRTLEALPGVVAVGAHANGSAPLVRAGGFGGGASGTTGFPEPHLRNASARCSCEPHPGTSEPPGSAFSMAGIFRSKRWAGRTAS